MTLPLTHFAFYVVSYAASLCGLLPFRLSLAPFRITSSRPLLRYSIGCAAVCSVGLIALQVHYFVANMLAIKANTLLIVVALQSLFSTLRTVLLYFLQLRHRSRFEQHIADGFEIFEALQRLRAKALKGMTAAGEPLPAANRGAFLDEHGRRQVAVKALLLGLETLLVFGTIQLHQQFSRGRSFGQHFIYGCIVFGTDGLTVIFSGVYAAVLIVMLQFLRELGDQLGRCMRRVRRMRQRRWVAESGQDGGGGGGGGLGERGSAMRMQEYCDISDTVDALNRMYGRVLQFVRQMSDMFALHVLLTLLNSFVSTLAQLFYIYKDVSNVWRNQAAGTIVAEFAFDVMSWCFYVVEIVSIVWLTNGVQKEGTKIGHQLYEVALDIDDRLKESISIFSIHVLTQTPAVRICGLFNVDYAFIYGICGTLISYITLLIQFELTDRKQ